MTLGKGIGGGVPLAALLAKEAACCFEHGDQGGTYNGNSLMTAAGSAILDAVLKPEFLPNVQEVCEYLTRALKALSTKHALGEVRGRGLLLALDLRVPTGSAIAEKARDKGVLLNSPRPDALRFMPALNVTRAEIDAMIEVLDTTLAEVKSAAAEAVVPTA